jgi:hypothetical protein
MEDMKAFHWLNVAPKVWQLLVGVAGIFIIAVVWVVNVNNGIAAAADKAKDTDQKIEKVLAELKEFNKTQSQHNNQDEVYKEAVKGRLELMSERMGNMSKDITVMAEDVRSLVRQTRSK